MVYHKVNFQRKHVAGFDLDFTKVVRKVFYVDDLAVSVINAVFTENVRFVSQRGFNLRKFRTNNSDVRQVHNYNEVKFDAEEQGNVLGISWDEVGDLLIMRYEDFLNNSPCVDFAKRDILRIIASFYDPLGLIQHSCPIENNIPGNL